MHGGRPPTKYNILDAAVHQDDLQVVQEVLAPLARYILRQRSLLEKLSQDVARRNELVEELCRCETVKEEREIIEEMEALERTTRTWRLPPKEERTSTS